jgi:hypothetical protein
LSHPAQPRRRHHRQKEGFSPPSSPLAKEIWLLTILALLACDVCTMLQLIQLAVLTSLLNFSLILTRYLFVRVRAMETPESLRREGTCNRSCKAERLQGVPHEVPYRHRGMDM